MDEAPKNYEPPLNRHLKETTRKLAPNPFGKPFISSKQKLKEVRALMQAPWVPYILQFLILLIVLTLIGFFYLTVGVAAQFSGLLLDLIRQSREEIEPGNLIESSGHVVAIGIYSICLVPLWLLQAPFLLLGWLWDAVLARMGETSIGPQLGSSTQKQVENHEGEVAEKD